MPCTAAGSSPPSRTGRCAATQFHPEKSGDAGLTLLENWVRACERDLEEAGLVDGRSTARSTARRTTRRRRSASSASRRTSTRRRTPALATTVGTALGTLAVAAVLDASWGLRIGLFLAVLVIGTAYVLWRHRAEITAAPATAPADRPGHPTPAEEPGHPPREPHVTDRDQPRLQLLPAVDVAGGRAVQLVQGVAGSGGEFGDPVEAALRWQEQGSRVAPPRRPRRGVRARVATPGCSPRSSAASTSTSR